MADVTDVIYLDNNATTRVAPEVVEAMLPAFGPLYGNASSMHTFGGQMGRHMALAREQVAGILGADPEEIIFTSCGSESDNAAWYSATETQPEKRHVITTKVEHSAVLAYGHYLEDKGYEVTWLGVDEKGQISLEELERALRPDTALVSMMYANNETGTIFPIEKVASIVKSHGVQLHVDAVQAVGKEVINLAKLPIDYLALSGHKLHAPKGIGALYVRRGTRFRPYVKGGHQERGRRAGTENVPYIIGLGKACELASSNMEKERTQVAALRDRLQEGLLAAIPHCKINGDQAHRLPNTLNISFEAVEGEALLLQLDQYHICASSGSACTSGSLEPSHVLRAMGVPFNYAHGSVRFSLSRYNTREEIERVIEVMPGIVEELRKISPFAAFLKK
ncbi:cysteine desulfurase NifS [Mailhella massiliensis]|uniref:Cysteine desulfurase n=1 Tax=Mailhella massiliensis TaxID=1903261 RepID=A0A921DQI0_9BACT|nr:cysteine desulfurase NifS [Mailhella massiliensis]HJD96560.1 cysteine desulfurase NifS [Mailhella massiliensis]